MAWHTELSSRVRLEMNHSLACMGIRTSPGEGGDEVF